MQTAAPRRKARPVDSNPDTRCGEATLLTSTPHKNTYNKNYFSHSIIMIIIIIM